MAQPTAAESKLTDKNNNPQIANKQAAIVAASVAHASTGTADLNALGTVINNIISVLEAHGLTADN